MTNIVTWPTLYYTQYRTWVMTSGLLSKYLPSTFSKEGEKTENMFAVSEGRVLAIWLKHPGDVEVAQSAKWLPYKHRDPSVSHRAHVKHQTWWCTHNPSTGEGERGGLPGLTVLFIVSLLDELQTSKRPCLKPPSGMRSGNQDWPLASVSTVIRAHPTHTAAP